VYNDENIRILAESAVAETGMGRVADKIAKHKNKVMGVLRDIRGVRTVGLMEIDQARGLRKYAKPVGVVGALVPVTNPTAHPRLQRPLDPQRGERRHLRSPPQGQKIDHACLRLYARGAQKVGAPVDLVQVIEEPSIELTQELMRQVDLIVATGGGAMVKAAYSSGKPAYGVGPGNAVQLLCEDADADDAAQKSPPRRASTTRQAARARTRPSFTARSGIASSPDSLGRAGTSATRPRNAPCVTTSGSSVKTDRRTSTPPSIAQNADTIARGAGFEVPPTTRFLVVIGEQPIESDRFFWEKLSPVLTVLPCDSFEQGMSYVERITDLCGTGHSSGIFTFNDDYIEKMGAYMRSSRIMVRQPMVSGNGGAFFNGMPSTVTLGCGTWGNNITTENIHWKQFINVTWLAMPIEPNRPSDESIFGAYWERYGK